VADYRKTTSLQTPSSDPAGVMTRPEIFITGTLTATGVSYSFVSWKMIDYSYKVVLKVASCHLTAGGSTSTSLKKMRGYDRTYVCMYGWMDAWYRSDRFAFVIGFLHINVIHPCDVTCRYYLPRTRNDIYTPSENVAVFALCPRSPSQGCCPGLFIPSN